MQDRSTPSMGDESEDLLSLFNLTAEHARRHLSRSLMDTLSGNGIPISSGRSSTDHAKKNFSTTITGIVICTNKFAAATLELKQKPICHAWSIRTRATNVLTVCVVWYAITRFCYFVCWAVLLVVQCPGD